MTESNLVARLGTAGVVLPFLLWLLFRGPEWAWCAVVLLVTVAAAVELFMMTHPADLLARTALVGSTLALSLAFYVARGDARVLLTALFAATAVGVLVPLARVGDISTAAFRVFAGVAGPIYIGALLATVMLLRRDLGEAGPAWVFLALVIAWVGDTGGYFFGRLFGKRKLYAAVSPKKTVEGFFGCLAAATLGAVLVSVWLLPDLSVGHALGLGVGGGALGQLGDLVESLLKRSTGVKDSGNLVPGHGGVLDRIDAILVVAPLVYVYALWT